MTRTPRHGHTKEHQARYAARRKAEDPEGWAALRVSVSRAWVKRHPEKTRAHYAVRRAVSKGILVRPAECSRCARVARIEASHDDYTKPLDVEWLCRQCHARKDAGYVDRA